MALRREGARPVRILMADDHPPMRSAFAAILAYGRGLEVVGEAHDGREAVLKCEQLRPKMDRLVLVSMRSHTFAPNPDYS